MDVVQEKKKKPRFKTQERHIRWNWEKSPSSDEDRELIRYHFVIVDDKNREGKIRKIISNFQEQSIINFPLNPVREIEGKFSGTEFRYLFVSYDTEYTPKFLSFLGVSKNIKMDSELRERTRGTIEDYVAGIYEQS